MPTGENSTTPGSDAYEWAQISKERERHAAQQRQAYAGRLLGTFMEKHNANLSALEQQKKQYSTNVENQRSTALQQMMERNAQMREQADRVASQPMKTPISVSSAPPLGKIDNIDPSSALAGNNAATQSFFLTPESTQSQFAVGAPVGGGNIGQRQKGSTNDLTSNTDNLGARRKDEL